MLPQGLAGPGLRLVAVLALLVVASSCGDSTEPEEDEPSVTQLRLTIGSTTKTFTGAAGEDRSFTVARGANAVTARWLRVDGTDDPVATTATFTLRVVPSSGSITYTPSATQSFTGTLNVSAAVTNAPTTFALFHVAEGHEDFGPITINITAP
jgi:hypothetical protein